MINWPAKLFQRKAASAGFADEPRPYSASGDKEILEAADEALRTVIDPELGINIVDLGLVYRLTARRTAVEAEIGLTSPSCPLAEHIVGQACEAVWQAVGPKIAVNIGLNRERRWSADMMSPAARRQLGRY